MASKKHQEPPDEAEIEPTAAYTHAPHEPERNGMRLAQATIPAGQALSDAVEISGASIEFIVMPDAWTPATLTFAVSFDGTSFHDLFGHNGAEVGVASVNPKTVIDVTDKPLNVGQIKLRSGGRNAPKNQAEARTFTLVIVS